MKKKLSIILGLALTWGALMLSQIHMVNAVQASNNLVTAPISHTITQPITKPITHPISYVSYIFRGNINYRYLIFRYVRYWPFVIPHYIVRPAVNATVEVKKVQSNKVNIGQTNDSGFYFIQVSESTPSAGTYTVRAYDKQRTYFWPRMVNWNVIPSTIFYKSDFWGLKIAQAPRLHSINPKLVSPGTRLSLIGTGFDLLAFNNRVYVNGSLMPQQFNSLLADGSLSFLLTSGLGFKPGSYRVYVENEFGRSNSLTIQISQPDITCKCDINKDGVVNIKDFSILATCFGKSASCTRADINGDGIVNILDFSLLASRFGQRVDKTLCK